MNIQSAESTSASVPAVETTVTSGDSSKNVVDSQKQAISNAKTEILNRHKPKVQEQKVEKVVQDSKGEEPVVEVDKTNDEEIPKSNEKLLRAREKDKKEISKLTAQKYAFKEEKAKLLAEIESLKKKQANEPVREDFEDDNSFNRAKIRHDIEVDSKIEHINEANVALEEKRHTDWTEKCQMTVKDFDKFAKIYSANRDNLMKTEPELMSVASTHIMGPRLLEEAFSSLRNPNNFMRGIQYKDGSPVTVGEYYDSLSTDQKIQYLREKADKIMHSELYTSSPQTKAPAPIQKSKATAMIDPERVSERVATKPTNTTDAIARYRDRLLNR